MTRLVRVQHQHQRRPLLDDPYPRMTMAVDAPRMPFGQTEPAFQVQVILRQASGRCTSHKESRLKTRHHFGQVLLVRIAAAVQFLAQGHKLRLPFLGRAVPRFERGRHLADVLDLPTDLLLRAVDLVQPAINAPG